LKYLYAAQNFRKVTLPLTIIYLANLSVLSWQYSDINGSNPNTLQKYILLGFPVYITGLSIWRTWFKKTK